MIFSGLDTIIREKVQKTKSVYDQESDQKLENQLAK